MRCITLWTVLGLLLTAVVTTANDWPQFRGPSGQGYSSDTELPLEWNESKNIAWKVPVPGLGWSSPVIADGQVWLTSSLTSDTGASLRLLGYDLTSGQELFNTEVFHVDDSNSPNPKNSLASPTPVLDPSGDRIYVHFGSYGTAALTTDGDVVWSTNFPYISQHGNGGSPILYQDSLILSIDGYDTAYVVAIDTITGEERWRAMRQAPVSQAYSTPLVIRVGETDQIVSVAAYRTTAHNPSTGKEIWSVGYRDGFSNVPRPVYGQGMVYLSTGFQTPSLLAVQTNGVGDVTDTHVAWRLNRGAPLTPSPLLVGNELYVINDFGIVTCIDATTGDVHWQNRIGGNHSASPVYANGRIYFQSEEGVTTVIQSGTDFQILAQNELDGETLASMAVSSGTVVIRTNSHLYRIASEG